MAYSENAFTKVSRNTPVRDELVLSLGDIFPNLKSAQGISVVKHTKRGQSEERRLRLDTDLSTLEVFRTSSGYINRKMLTRAYNLSHLDEVGPATSVPGGLPATPGRTLLFVFHSRKLFVTVSSRDVGAALVALFRPGGSASHASPRLVGNPPGGGERPDRGDDLETFGRRRTGSPSSPSSRSSSATRGGVQLGRRVPHTGDSSRSQESHSSIGTNARDFLGLGEPTKGSNGFTGVVNGYVDGSGKEGTAQRGSLKRSASFSGGLETFEIDGVSTSSSEVDMVMSTPDGMQSQHQPSEAPLISATRSTRSPESAYSSESPEAVMRSRVVGFGSEDLGIDAKPKRQGKAPSRSTPWARFMDGEKITMAAGMASSSSSAPRVRAASVVLAVEGKASVAEVAGQSAGASSASGEAADSSDLRAVADDGHSPGHSSGDFPPGAAAAATAAAITFNGRESASPLAVRVEDRLTLESLRRPASAPVGLGAPGGGQGEPLAPAPNPRPSRTPKSKSTSLGTRGGKRAKSPPTRRLAGAGEVINTNSISQPPSTTPPGQQRDYALVLSRKADLSRDASGSRKGVLRDHNMTERKIPPMRRMVPGVQQQQQQPPSLVKKDEQSLKSALLTSYDRESDVSPPRSKHGHTNGTRGGQIRREIAQSESIDSLDNEEACEIRGAEKAASEPIEYCVDRTARGETEGADKGMGTVSVPADPGRGVPLPNRARSKRTGARHEPTPTSLPSHAGRKRIGASYEPTPTSLATQKQARLGKVGGSSPETSRHSTDPERSTLRIETTENGTAVAAVTATVAATISGGNGTTPLENGPIFGVEGLDSFGPPTLDACVRELTIEAAPSVEYLPPSAGTHYQLDVRPFSTATPPVVDARGGEEFRRACYSRRGSTATDCTSPDSPPGGAVGEVRATPFHLAPRPMPLMTGLSLGGSHRELPKGPSGFEELWAVLEPGWGMNSSFGTSMAPKVMLLGDIYQMMRSLQTAVARVCVQACGPVLAVVCGKCGRAWAMLSSTAPDSLADFPALGKIEKALCQLITAVELYGASAVVRRLTLPLIGKASAWEEILSAGEGDDLHGPLQQIETAIALLPGDDRKKGRSGSEGGGGVGRRSGGGGRQALFRGGSSKGGRRRSSSDDLRLWLPICPTLWAKEQFGRLTPLGLEDVMTLMHEPARFAELAQLVICASDEGPTDGVQGRSPAWDCVRMAEGPALGRELRRALAATLVAAGELLPLPRVPPPPPAYVPRDRLSEQVEATILHPFLPLSIAGIGGPSGSGKTVLAAAVVGDATVRSRFGDRVFWLHAGKGARNRLISILQALADTVYAWLMEDEHATTRRGFSGGGGGSISSSGSGRRGMQAMALDLEMTPELREPVRFRDQDQALDYVASLCRRPSLAGLRCLVVLDDVHERDVVDAIWRSGCQLLITSPDQGLLQAIGAEATIVHPLGDDDAKQVAAGAAAEETLCEEANAVLDLCHGCPLALAMSGAVAQAMLSAGSDTREWRRPRLGTPRSTMGVGDQKEAKGAGRKAVSGTALGSAMIGTGWSLGNTFSNIAAPVGAWVEQVVVGTASLPSRRAVQHGGAPSEEENGAVVKAKARRRTHELAQQASAPAAVSENSTSATVAAPVASRKSVETTAWSNLAARIESGRNALRSIPSLRQALVEAGPECELPTREVLAVLTQVALEEADRILAGSRLGTDCFLSFSLLPEGLPLPPPALEKFWLDEDVRDAGTKVAVAASGVVDSSAFTDVHHHGAPGPVEVFEALRLLGRAGGGEGADGLIPHGIQRLVAVSVASLHPDRTDRMAQRRARMLSRISSLVGTFEDDCWALGGGGGEEMRIRRAAAAALRDRSHGAVVSSARERGDRGNDPQVEPEPIPTGLLGSSRPGPPSHGYGGFSRYDYLVASWDALPAQHTMSDAAVRYLASVRASRGSSTVDTDTAAGRGSGSSGGAGWAEARALASAADVCALVGRGSEAIPAYREAGELLAAEAERDAGRPLTGVSSWQQNARSALHKVASMVQDLAGLTAHLGEEAPAIRLLQRAVEIHLSVLEASGALVPSFGGGRSGGDIPFSEMGAKEASGGRERGGGITRRAVAEDDRPLPSRLWLHASPAMTAGEPSPSGRSSGGGGGGGTLPTVGRLDVVSTCVEDLGVVVKCTRQLCQKKRVEESAQLSEKVYPVLKEILGADHAFTRAALAGFVGQVIVDECWSQSDVAGGGSGHPNLPSPTSRRRLARIYGGRGPCAIAARMNAMAGGGGGSSDRPGSSVSASTLSELSSPPSPLPDFHIRPTSLNSAHGGGSTRTPLTRLTVCGKPGMAVSSRDRFLSAGDSKHRDRDRERSSSGFSNNESTSSGTDVDDDSDAGGAWSRTAASRRAGRVGMAGRLSFQRRFSERPPHVSRTDAAAGQGWRRESGGGGMRRGSVEPSSTRMQQELYFRHRTRRALAHAFLITTATRARLKKVDRAEANLFLMDLARQAGAAVGEKAVARGAAGGLPSPEEAQMAKLKAPSRGR